MLNLNEYLKALQSEGLFSVRHAVTRVVPDTVFLQTCFHLRGTCTTIFWKAKQCLSVHLGVLPI
jgi:hypothetical protein